jgi:hypothetical protein
VYTLQNQYDSLAVSVSDGPIVSVWAKTWRAYTYGSERFVTGRSLMPVPIVINPRPGAFFENGFLTGIPSALHIRMIVLPRQARDKNTGKTFSKEHHRAFMQAVRR